MGQNGEFSIRGRGACKTLSLNWMVFDHHTPITAPDEWRTTSERHRCLSRSNLPGAGMRKFDFRKNVKKPTRHAAQKDMSNG